MPLVDVRITNYRGFSDSGVITVGPTTAIVGANDVGKSAILHALSVFFAPPKKGGLASEELHGKNANLQATVEVSFDPQLMRNQELRIDAKNNSHLVDDRLVDSRGLLRARLTLSASRVEAFELLISDVDDSALFPLGLKGHDELLALLADWGLPATPAGKETNQQKRKSLRDEAARRGMGARELWVDASAIEKPLRAILPELVFFEDTARYGIGETPVQNQFKSVVDKAISSQAAAKTIETGITTAIQGAFDDIFIRLSRLTSTVTGLKASPVVSWKKAVEGINLDWTDSSGLSLPYELRGAGVRRLFMVAYFQYEAAAASHSASGPQYIFAVEEPELHLHPGAQRQLVSALRDLAALGHRVLFTTHSPVFAASTPIDNLVLVTNSGAQSQAVQTPALDAHAVALELGVEASDRLVGKDYVVLVEGKSDEAFLQVALAELHGAGHTTLDPAKVLFLQCGGVGNLRHWVTTAKMDEVGVKWAVIADSDRQSAGASPSKVAAALLASPPPTCSATHVLTRTALENYLDPGAIRAVTQVDCLVPHFGKPTTLQGMPLPTHQVEQIKAECGAIARQMGSTNLLQYSLDDNGSSEWVELFEALRIGFGL